MTSRLRVLILLVRPIAVIVEHDYDAVEIIHRSKRIEAVQRGIVPLQGNIEIAFVVLHGPSEDRCLDDGARSKAVDEIDGFCLDRTNGSKVNDPVDREALGERFGQCGASSAAAA